MSSSPIEFSDPLVKSDLPDESLKQERSASCVLLQVIFENSFMMAAGN